MARSFSVSTIFSAVNRMSGPVSSAVRSITGLGRSTTDTGRQTSSVFRSMVSHIRSVATALTSTRARFRFHNEIQRVKELTRSFRELGSTIAGIATPGLGSLAVVAGAGYVAKKGVDAASEREDAEISLSTMYGGKKQGKERAEFLNKMAKKLPYEFSDYLAADVVMKDVGKTATESEFKGLASIASAKNIDFSNFVRDMRGMDTEGLKTILGASAMPESKDGVLSLNDTDGKRVSFKKDEKGIAKFYTFLAKWGNKKYPGLADDRGEALSGRTATLSDTGKDVAVTSLVNTGWYDYIKKEVEQTTNFLNQQAPRLESIFSSAFKSIQGNTGLLDSVNHSFAELTNITLKELDKLLKSITSNDSSTSTALKSFFDTLPSKFEAIITSVKGIDWEQTATQISTTASNVLVLCSALGSLINTITPLVQFLQHPWDSTFGSLRETAKLTKNADDTTTQAKDREEKYSASLSPKERSLLEKRQKEENEKRNTLRSAPFTSVLKNEVSNNIANTYIPDKKQPVNDPNFNVNIANNPVYPSIVSKPQILNPVQQKPEPTKVESTNNITIKVEDNRAPTVTTQTTDNGTKTQTNVKNVGRNRRTN